MPRTTGDRADFQDEPEKADDKGERAKKKMEQLMIVIEAIAAVPASIDDDYDEDVDEQRRDVLRAAAAFFGLLDEVRIGTGGDDNDDRT